METLTTEALLPIGSVVRFNSRRGHVIGYWTGKRHGHAAEVQTFYVVDLDSESGGYLIGDNDARDCYVTVTLIDVTNVDSDGNGDGIRPARNPRR